MCGIAGILGWKFGNSLEDQVLRMIATLNHRGPDSQGVWVDTVCGVGLGHTRLSIFDLSSQGHQPMISASGRYVTVFNGEIYNFKDLKNRLEKDGVAPCWRGNSDTEVLLACVEAWGIEKTLKDAIGMFAFSLWDKETKTLSIARDRLGEKPLYYGEVAGNFFFSSELKALKAVAGNSLQIDRNALTEFMQYGYIPAPASIYQGIYKLPPGHWIQVDCLSHTINTPKQFWNLKSEETACLRIELASASDQILIDTVEQILSKAIRAQMVADVPLGAFLSGGVDSSAVVALMQAHSIQRVQTFTIGFDQSDFNEAPYAKKIANHLNTIHTELYITERDAEELIPKLPFIYDEPFADSSQIPTVLVSQLASKHVKVSLSGDGGDELFAGYNRYKLIADMWGRIGPIPKSLRHMMGLFIRRLPTQSWDKSLSVLPNSLQNLLNGRRLHRFARLLTANNMGQMYLRMISQWYPEEEIVLGASLNKMILREWDSTCSNQEAMRKWDCAQYLPDDLLVKVDRASMSTSLEVRSPMLDHHLVELAFALPERALIRDEMSKWVMRQVLYRYVPSILIERPKSGFSVPLGRWLRGPLQSWANELLEPRQLSKEGLLDAQKVNTIWKEHLRGRFDCSSYLWNILMFQSWFRFEKRLL